MAVPEVEVAAAFVGNGDALGVTALPQALAAIIAANRIGTARWAFVIGFP